MNAGLKAGSGFTIVETMIFLAISGLMFVLAISAMSGKQQQTEFQTGVSTLRSELTQNLSSVDTGDYPALNNLINCTASDNGSPTFDGTKPDGTCTLIGEILLFNNNSYYVMPVFGRTYVGSAADQEPAVNFNEEVPTIDTNSVDTNIVQQVTMPFQTYITNNTSDPNISIGPGHYDTIGLFGFSTNNSTDTGSPLSSGSQQVEVFVMPINYSNSETPAEIATTFNLSGLTNCTYTDAGDNESAGACLGGTNPSYPAEPINPSGGISFCIASGTTDNQSALFTIGGFNLPDQVTYAIKSSSNCL
jgi:type II secretory pathway pseudopilin PulG